MLKWGLLLQIPNVAILTVIAVIYFGKIISLVNLNLIDLRMFWFIVLGLVYGLVNIFSIIFIVSGLLSD